MLRFDHLSLGVSDVDASERFYRDALGLPVERDGEDAVVRSSEFLLILTPRPPAERGKFHFGFCVDTAAEVDTWGARLREHGGTRVSGPFDHDGSRKIYFTDPDDYQIEIYSRST